MLEDENKEAMQHNVVIGAHGVPTRIGYEISQAGLIQVYLRQNQFKEDYI